MRRRQQAATAGGSGGGGDMAALAWRACLLALVFSSSLYRLPDAIPRLPYHRSPCLLSSLSTHLAYRY